MKKNHKYNSFLFFLLLFVGHLLICQINKAQTVQKIKTDPEIDIHTPAFQKEEGFTNYNELIEFLTLEAAKNNKLVHIEWIGESGLGKKIPAVIFDKGSKQDKIKIWMQGGLHGNEPAGTEGLLMLIHDLLTDPKAESLFDRISLMIVPMANIDGYEKQSRYTASNADLNRDQTMLSEPETRCLKRAYNNYSPHIAIDIHEYQPNRPELKNFYDSRISIPYDVLFLPSGNLNIPHELNEIVHNLFLENAKLCLQNKGLSTYYYFLPKRNSANLPYLKMGGSSPRSSASSYGLSNAISILFELRGIGLERELFKRRVYSGFLLSKNILETAYHQNMQVKESIQKAIKTTLSLKENIVIEAEPGQYQDNVEFLDLDHNTMISLPLNIADENQSVAVKTRKRPGGYLLLPECKELAFKLKILGLEIDTLNNDKMIKLESYIILTSGKPISQDKFSVNEVSFQLKRLKKNIPSGSFFISTKQKNANLAIVTLEPDMRNSFVRYGILPAKNGDVLPIYRVSKNFTIKNNIDTTKLKY